MPDWLLTKRGYLTALSLYVLVLYLIKGTLYWGGLGHDVDQIVTSQTTQLGYDNRNPPLYTWLVIASQAVFGVGLPAVLVVKSTMIFSLYLFLYLSARLVLRNEAMAVLAALAPFAMYEVGLWLAIKYSHTAALAAMCAATFYVLLRLEDAGKTIWYAGLGAVIGLGLLAKYNYVIFLLSLLTACLFDPGFRARFRDRRILVTAAIALILFLPHVYWMAVHVADFEESAASRFGIGGSEPRLLALGIGLLASVKAILNMLAPLVAIALFLAWRSFRKGIPGDWPSKRYFRLLGIFLLLSVASIFILVIGSGATMVRGQYLFILVIFPIWLFAWIQALGLPRVALRGMGLAFTSLALLTPVVMVGKYFTHPLTHDYTPYNMPYAVLAEQLRGVGFQAGTLYTFDSPYTLSGNLRPYFPASRVVARAGGKTAVVRSIAPERTEHGQCILIWAVDRKSTQDKAMTKAAQELFGFEGTEGSELLQSEVKIMQGRGRAVHFQYRFFPEGPGSCH
ncbi:MAG: glycosyltransferase family 39 protein [Acidiferrobacterales bacterium]